LTLAVAVRPRVAFIDFADVFEDFYPHLGIDHQAFATTWAGTGNHSFSSVIQEFVGNVTWYELSLSRSSPSERHALGMQVNFVRSSLIHRALWKTFYARNWSWRLRSAYRTYATASSYLAPLSVDFVRTLRRDRPDALFVQDYSSGRFDVLLAAARLLRVPLITYHSGSTPDAYTGRILRKRTLRRADAILVTSTREAQHLTDEFGVDPALCRVVLTPIDTSVFSPNVRNLNDERYLLFVGRLDDAVKRVSAILAAFERARGRHNVRLLVVGDGEDGQKLRALGQKLLGEVVEFLGWVEEPERLAHLYANADALILASVREGFPTVVGEALACGTPVIATDVGGVSEVVSDEVTGRLLPAGDDVALTDTLTEVIENPALYAAMRPAARRVAEERLGRAVVGGKLIEIFNRALGNRSS
jgi:glycosyltransferase involved in cell wall biosynthesis